MARLLFFVDEQEFFVFEGNARGVACPLRPLGAANAATLLVPVAITDGLKCLEGWLNGPEPAVGGGVSP